MQTAGGAIALVAGTVDGGPRAPSGRLVQRLSADGFQLPEEEIGRAGVQLRQGRLLLRRAAEDQDIKIGTAVIDMRCENLIYAAEDAGAVRTRRIGPESTSPLNATSRHPG